MTSFSRAGRTAHLSESPVQVLSIDQKNNSLKTQAVQIQVQPEKGPEKTVLVNSSPFRIGSGPQNDLVLNDPFISDQHCRLRLEEAGWFARDLASTNGLYANGEKISQCKITSGLRLRLGKTDLTLKLVQQKETVEPSRSNNLHELVGTSPSMRSLFSLIEKIAPVNEIVLIQGESGTGKELVARALHQSSPRIAKPFVAINCGAISAELIESELFGHEKGAFTGAHAERAGVFESAGEGTLFLDEIGELPLSLQPKLLRVLEQRSIRRVGGSREIPVHCRVVTATHRNLEVMVKEGTFRKDLYFRLNILPLSLPALRDRSEDIPLLAEHILSSLGSKKLTDEALQCCLAYAWPGNIRELKNVLKAASYLGSSSLIEAGDLRIPGGSRVKGPASVQNVAEAQRDVILKQLILNKGNKTRTAEILGVAKSTLFRLMRKYQIGDEEFQKESQTDKR